MKLNKKQKRTATIASMAALLAVVLGMGGQTFAKYITTTQTETKGATVAKWGFVANITATDMFKDKYATDDSSVSIGDDTDGVSVVASNVTVAPGTSGEMFITFTGSAEVDTKVTFDTTGVEWSDVYLGSGNVAGQKEYYPIVWTLKNGGTVVKEGHLSDIKKELENNTGYYNAGADFDLEYTLSWKWDFTQVNTATNVENYSTSDSDDTLTSDEADTRLGLISEDPANATVVVGGASNMYRSSVNVNLSLKITVEQVD